jgi:hypothetical protein
MPMIKGRELSKEVLKCYKFRDSIPAEIRRMIEENFENALDFLASDKPWLSESENQRHRAIYLELRMLFVRCFGVRGRFGIALHIGSRNLLPIGITIVALLSL